MRLAIRNDSGECARQFRQGERIHFFFEFEILRDIWRPAGGAELVNEDGIVVHGKNMFQHGLPSPHRLHAGAAFSCHIWFDLQISPGTYTVTLGLASTDEEAYAGYVLGEMSYEEFAPRLREHCRVVGASVIEIGYRADSKLSHHGVADLPGGAEFEVCPCAVRTASLSRAETHSPTVFHITHWKAGSQWIYKILSRCLPELIVQPQIEEAQVRCYPIRKGHVYPTVYLTRPEMNRIEVPPDSRRFVVIRDLRDTLVSAYFSFKVSHPILKRGLRSTRNALLGLGEEDGMLYLMETFLPLCADVQISWLNSGELLLKYEDLLRDDYRLLEHALIEHCGLAIDRQTLKSAVAANRFETLTGGRPPGVEDVSAHERKGVAGDWRNYFSPRLKAVFNLRFGGVLVAAGYERDLKW
jgi:lipopolysaccharide transport system ATP-binding protein